MNFLDVAAELLDPTPHPYRHDSAAWCREVLAEYVTEAQQDIYASVRDHRYTAVQSCHDVGKSKSAANISCHWIETYPSGEAFLVTTAPTDPQVKNILWREIGRTYRKGPGGRLKGRITLDAQWKIPHALGPDEPVGYGRKPADTDPAAFQGIHARYVLVVIDEACGVPKAIFDAVDSLATNIDARVLAIGNPDDPASHFAKVCRPGSGWNVLKIDALRSPNFTRERVGQFPDIRRLMIQEGIKPNDEPCPDALRPLLVDPSWVQERIKRWGIGSPLWQAKVRGEFPEVSVDSLIEPRWVRKAQERTLARDVMDVALGVDVARYGQDKTVIVLREGGRCRVVKEAGKSSNPEVAGWVQQIGGAHVSFPVRAQVDDVGVGGGVTDILRENNYPVIPMIGQARCIEMLPSGRPKFVNARAEWYWALREAFQQDMIDIAPDQNVYDDDGRLLEESDDDMAAQLLAIKYGVNSHGQIWVETKDEMAKRGMPSPDRADALAYSWAVTGAAWVPSVADHGGRSETGDLMKAGW